MSYKALGCCTSLGVGGGTLYDINPSFSVFNLHLITNQLMTAYVQKVHYPGSLSDLRKTSLICSSRLPFVSGTKKYVNIPASSVNPAMRTNHPALVISLVTCRNVIDISNFVAKVVPIATAMPADRAHRGNISEATTRDTGPRPAKKHARNIISPITVKTLMTGDDGQP